MSEYTDLIEDTISAIRKVPKPKHTYICHAVSDQWRYEPRLLVKLKDLIQHRLGRHDLFGNRITTYPEWVQANAPVWHHQQKDEEWKRQGRIAWLLDILRERQGLPRLETPYPIPPRPETVTFKG
jgi:hypothetical protein